MAMRMVSQTKCTGVMVVQEFGKLGQNRALLRLFNIRFKVDKTASCGPY